jgi:hypothetical protein
MTLRASRAFTDCTDFTHRISHGVDRLSPRYWPCRKVARCQAFDPDHHHTGRRVVTATVTLRDQRQISTFTLVSPLRSRGTRTGGNVVGIALPSARPVQGGTGHTSRCVACGRDNRTTAVVTVGPAPCN